MSIFVDESVRDTHFNLFTQERLHLLPASDFSFEELTEAYNQTRVDYIVPMPMNAAKLREYVETYDVDMDASAVVVEGSQILALGMLGTREGRAWTAPGDRRGRGDRQGRRHRPEPNRADPALEPRDLYRRLRLHPGDVLPRTI